MAADDHLNVQQFFHRGTDPSEAAHGDYIHVGTKEQAMARSRSGGERNLYAVSISPKNPFNSPAKPLDDTTANRIGMYDSAQRWLGRRPRKTDFDPDFEDAPEYAKSSGWKSNHDAIYYLNDAEGERPAVSAMVRRSAITSTRRIK